MYIPKKPDFRENFIWAKSIGKMKIKFKYILYTSLILAVGIPSFFIFINLINGHIENGAIRIRFIGVFFSFLVSISIAGADTRITYLLQKRFPWQKNFTKRLTIELVITNIIATIIISFWHTIFMEIFGVHLKNHPENTYLNNIIVAIVINTIVILIYEGVYMVTQWKKALVEAEKMKRESVESQFAALKNQINPHFLFNSLNALDSLITQSPEKAKEFVNRFSKIYRYVLDVKDKLVIEIKEEVAFINNFYSLQKVRYGKNLTMNVNIDAEVLNYFIPCLSLQMLVENAIKHNEISSKFPLRIEITNDKDYLIITNKMQAKQGSIEKSTGIGIQNLIERYSHFSTLEPQFTISGENYIAKLPILKEE